MADIITGKFTHEVGTVKLLVEEALVAHPHSREDDNFLCRCVVLMARERRMKEPAFETITRCRRKVHAEGRLLPRGAVLERRKAKEKQFSELMRRLKE